MGLLDGMESMEFTLKINLVDPFRIVSCIPLNVPYLGIVVPAAFPEATD